MKSEKQIREWILELVKLLANEDNKFEEREMWGMIKALELVLEG